MQLTTSRFKGVFLFWLNVIEVTPECPIKLAQVTAWRHTINWRIYPTSNPNEFIKTHDGDSPTKQDSSHVFKWLSIIEKEP